MSIRVPPNHRAARLARTRGALMVAFALLLGFSAYGTVSPAPVRCGLPGAVGCPGGLLGPDVSVAAAGEQWFTVTLFDYGFWIVDSTTGANESNAWNVFEGWTVHVNATSLAPDAAVGGTAYHGLGVEINQTGQQLLSLAAPVGTWTPGSFVAPLAEYHHQHLWCTIQCGPGHGGQQAWVLNVIPAVPLPKASATANVSSGTAPLAVAFSGVASAGTPPYSTSWDFGDGSPTAAGTTATHVYILGGDYQAQFRVTDAKGMAAASSVTVIVNSSAPLLASVQATPDNAVAPFPSVLSVEAHGGAPPYSYNWSFGDGTSATGANLTRHTYSAPGIYAVVATVRDSAGVSVRALTSVLAVPPVGRFPVSVSASPPNGTAPIIVQLTATPQGGTGPFTYLWVFGDGSTGHGASLAHQYNLSGSYEANVFVSDTAGHVGSAAVNVRLVPTSGGGGGGDERPNAATGALTVFPFATPTDGGTPLWVNATASIEAGAGVNDTVSWNFGDGTTGTGPVVAHQFAQVGTYTITVTASDSGGNQGTNQTVVRVEPLGMTLVVNRSVGDPAFSVTAAASVVGGTGRYGVVSWDWGDGITSTGDLANHTYAANTTGTIDITAQTTDSLGAPISAMIPISVNPVLSAVVIATLPSAHLPPVVVGFSLQRHGGSGGYEPLPLWNFGDGTSTRAGALTNHSYTKLGDYQVLVRTNDSLGSEVVASTWVNLSVAPAAQPGHLGGKPPWSLTGVSNPNQAALILIGVVAASGLALLYRRRRAAPAKTSTPGRPPAARPRAMTATPPGPRPAGGAPRTARPGPASPRPLPRPPT